MSPPTSLPTILERRSVVWEVIYVSSDPDEIHEFRAYPTDDARDVAQDATEHHDSNCAMELDDTTEIKVRRKGPVYDDQWRSFTVTREYAPSYTASEEKP